MENVQEALPSYDLQIILSYVFSFLLIFIMAFVGSLCKEIHDNANEAKIRIVHAIISSIFISIIICAINSYMPMKFPLLVLTSFVLGMWSTKIFDVVFNFKLMFIIIKNIFKQLSNPIMKGAGEAMQEMQDESNKKKSSDKDDKEKDIKKEPAKDPPSKEDSPSKKKRKRNTISME